jgi:CheY-like chemotaxis protein
MRNNGTQVLVSSTLPQQGELVTPARSDRLTLATVSGALAGWLACAPVALAQEKPPPPVKIEFDDYPKPQKPAEFWRAIRHETDQARYDLAAELVKQLLATNPDDKAWLTLAEEFGLAQFLRLRAVDNWAIDPRLTPGQKKKVQEEARANVETLIAKIAGAYKSQLTNPDRIAKLAGKLSATPEERSFAIVEIKKAGAGAIPTLIALLRNKPDPEPRGDMLSALSELDTETVQPLLAAFDGADDALRLDLLMSLRNRKDFLALPNEAVSDPGPTVLFWSANPQANESLRNYATTLAGLLYKAPLNKLPEARATLTAAAEKLYLHQTKLVPTTANDTGAKALPIYRWEGDTLKPGNFTPSQVEEYLGLRYAKWALTLDPSHEPAQVVFLSLATEKAFERAGLEAPLAKSAAGVHDLLVTASPATLTKVLDQALKAQRSAVALGAVQALGARADRDAVTAAPKGGVPILVRALDYADRRVQLAAAEAILNAPGSLDASVKTKAIDVLRRALANEGAASPQPKALLGDPDPTHRDQLTLAFQKAGYQVTAVATGREVVRRLAQASDIDLIVLDSHLPGPLLPDVLGQLKADVRAGALPVVLIAPTVASVAAGPALPVNLARYEMPSRARVRADANRVEQTLANELTNAKQIAHLQQMAKVHPLARVIREPFVAAQVESELAAAFADVAVQPLSANERKDFARRAAVAFRKLAADGVKVDAAAAEILLALKNAELAPLLIPVASTLPTAAAQQALANVLNDPSQSAELRALAGAAVAKHVQAHGLLLTKDHQTRLTEQFAAEKNADVHAQISAVLGALKPNAANSGARLLQYAPPTPSGGPKAEPVPPPPSKDN